MLGDLRKHRLSGTLQLIIIQKPVIPSVPILYYYSPLHPKLGHDIEARVFRNKLHHLVYISDHQVTLVVSIEENYGRF